MKEKLIIKNFGPIKDVELELGRFNILIGEQATGKSTVAKVLAVCRYFSYIIKSRIGDDNFAKGLDAWGLSEFIKYDKTYISYTCEHYYFEAQSITDVKPYATDGDQEPDEISFHTFQTKLEPISESFRNVTEELKRIIPDLYFDLSLPSTWQIPTSFFLNEVKAVLDNPFYFPVERGLQSIFSLGKNSIPNIDDALFNQFAKLDQIARSFKNETFVEPLNITYKNVNGQGFVKSSKHDFIRLSNAASGYQSTIPVVLVLKSYNNKTKQKRKTFIIEEPELNLFPNAQQKLMEYFVEGVNNYNNSFLINTHSPYILTSLNNMMYAWQVGQDKREKVVEIVEEKYWLNPEDIKAYQLLSDGTCESLIADDGLLMAEKIDVVSGKINEEFDKILNIQYSNDRPEEFSELQTSFG